MGVRLFSNPIIRLSDPFNTILQRSPLLCAPGLVKFFPAVAYLLCLALPGSFLRIIKEISVRTEGEGEGTQKRT